MSSATPNSGENLGSFARLTASPRPGQFRTAPPTPDRLRKSLKRRGAAGALLSCLRIVPDVDVQRAAAETDRRFRLNAARTNVEEATSDRAGPSSRKFGCTLDRVVARNRIIRRRRHQRRRYNATSFSLTTVYILPLQPSVELNPDRKLYRDGVRLRGRQIIGVVIAVWYLFVSWFVANMRLQFPATMNHAAFIAIITTALTSLLRMYWLKYKTQPVNLNVSVSLVTFRHRSSNGDVLADTTISVCIWFRKTPYYVFTLLYLL